MRIIKGISPKTYAEISVALAKKWCEVVYDDESGDLFDVVLADEVIVCLYAEQIEIKRRGYAFYLLRDEFVSLEMQ